MINKISEGYWLSFSFKRGMMYLLVLFSVLTPIELAKHLYSCSNFSTRLPLNHFVLKPARLWAYSSARADLPEPDGPHITKVLIWALFRLVSIRSSSARLFMSVKFLFGIELGKFKLILIFLL